MRLENVFERTGVTCVVQKDASSLQIAYSLWAASEIKARVLARLSIQDQVLYINVQWFRGGRVFEAHRLLDH